MSARASHGAAGKGLAGRLASPQEGQSFTEVALVLPGVLLLMLIAINIGLALRAHIAITQVTEQGAQYLIHHPTAATAPYTSLIAYMNSISPYPISNSSSTEVSVTIGTDMVSVGGKSVQSDTIKVDYPYPLVAPFLDKITFGSLQSGSIHLGAVASTVAATSAPQSICVNPAASGTSSGTPCSAPGISGAHVVGWTAPATNPSSVELYYCVFRSYTDINGTVYTDQRIGCTTATGATTYTDLQPSPAAQSGTTIQYRVKAVQADGVESDYSAYGGGS